MIASQSPDRPQRVIARSKALLSIGDSFTLRELLRNPDLTKEPKAVIPPFAFQDRVTLLSGSEKAGKSTLAGCIAAHVSNGREFLEQPTLQGKVLYFCLEEHMGELVRRAVNFEAHQDNLIVVDRVDDPISDLERWVSVHQPTLVIIDTLAAFVSSERPESSSSAAWTPLMLAISKVARDSETSILLLHHKPKNGSADYRDSGAIGATVDLIASMSEEGERGRRFKMKGRWVRSSITLHLDRDNKSYSLAGAESSLEKRVIMYIRENSGCSSRSVREGVTGGTSQISSTLRELEQEREIRKDEVGSSYKYFINEPIQGPIIQGGGT